ncbi:MAG: serine/threonine protein kinase [Labilithrix sp.]|nr:serine/threonine protein kinase [Labilithrix sp.]
MNEPSKVGPLPTPPEAFGRYVLYPPIAHGGMATVHTARLIGAEGFSRLVAAKRLHPQFTDEPDFVQMFHDEAQIASRIHHPNVVPVLDVVRAGGEVILVQEYVHGVPLNHLFRAALAMGVRVRVDVAVAVIAGVLAGLHAAHEARDDAGVPLNIVHRDVSPQNVIVSVDGVPRLLDFGIAKARTSAHVTREGFFKGKIAYMSPEQLRMETVTRTADVYATGVLAWELVVHRRVHAGQRDVEFLSTVVSGGLARLTAALEQSRSMIPDDEWEAIVRLEPIVARALSNDPVERYPTALAMMNAILEVCAPATAAEVAAWVQTVGTDFLERRQQVLASNEESWRSSTNIPVAPSADGSGVKASSSPRAPEPPISILSAAQADELVTGLLAAREERSRKLPWIVSGGLLLAVGVLLGIVLTRGEQSVKAAPIPTTTVAPPPAVSSTAPFASAEPPPAASAPEPPSAPQVTRPLPPPAPVVRWVAPPPRAHTPPATTSSSSASASASAPSKSDCNPPFYFEGTKKIFKPSCL